MHLDTKLGIGHEPELGLCQQGGGVSPFSDRGLTSVRCVSRGLRRRIARLCGSAAFVEPFRVSSGMRFEHGGGRGIELGFAS